MGQSLKEIAQTLRDTDKKVQLIYAFNGVGKTRLSREFKELVSPKSQNEEEEDTKIKVLYYNAFTEDLFFWDNDLKADYNRRLRIQPNSFTDWVLREQGQDRNIVNHFQRYTSDKLTPRFNEDFKEVTFSIEGGNEGIINNIKISKGEESCLIWCVFYSLLNQIVANLNIAEPDERETSQFNELQYIFIDDPVSSLDENHLIELAVNIAELIKLSQSEIKFIISTHNPLFYNILYNELDLKKKNKKGNECCFLLDKKDDGTFELKGRLGDSNKSFSYHHYLIQIIQESIDDNNIHKYHFMLLRNLYEKTANFLGYPQWSDLLPDDKKTYYNRVIQFTSHSTLSYETIPEPTEQEKQTLKLLFNYLIDNNYYTEKLNGTI